MQLLLTSGATSGVTSCCHERQHWWIDPQQRWFLHCNLFIFISMSVTLADNVFCSCFLGWIIGSTHFAFLVPWQAPYPSGQNAAPTTLVYPQAPQTMNTQPQTRSPVRSPSWPHFLFFPLHLCVSLSVCVYSTWLVLWKAHITDLEAYPKWQTLIEFFRHYPGRIIFLLKFPKKRWRDFHLPSNNTIYF